MTTFTILFLIEKKDHHAHSFDDEAGDDRLKCAVAVEKIGSNIYKIHSQSF